MKNDHGSWKPGDMAENDYGITVRYYRLEVEGRTILEMSPFDVSVGGSSVTQPIRNALLV
jgi:phage tail tube protein FII